MFSDAHLYRLAQANKMIRLGLITRNDDGVIVATPAMAEMDSPIVPDEIDILAVTDEYGSTRP